MKTQMVKIGSVWKGQSEEGVVYYSGPISVPFPIMLDKNNRILIFKNKSENKDAPDLDVLIAEKQSKQDRQTKASDDDEAF